MYDGFHKKKKIHMFLEHQISILESCLKDTIQSQFIQISQVYPFIGNIAGLQ